MLKMYTKTWDNFDEETNGAISFTEVKSKFCQPEDFNNMDGTNEESKFYANDEFAQHEIDRHGHKLKCIDAE